MQFFSELSGGTYGRKTNENGIFDKKISAVF